MLIRKHYLQGCSHYEKHRIKQEHVLLDSTLLSVLEVTSSRLTRVIEHDNFHGNEELNVSSCFLAGFLCVVFSAPDKLLHLFARVARGRTDVGATPRCEIQHHIQYVCDLVYETPFTCGKFYVSQTGRCLNLRLRVHSSSLKATWSADLAVHGYRSQYTLRLNHTNVLGTFKGASPKPSLALYGSNLSFRES